MKILTVLILLGVHGAAAVSHTLQYFYTGSTGLERFPEFVAVGIVDGEQIDYYDSVSEKNVLKQTWMEGVRDENSITDVRRGHQQNFKANVGVAMQRFNQTTGVHVFQMMYGCEWDDETGEINGFHQFGYDGDDFIAFDLKTQTWIAPTPQAVISKHKWDRDRSLNDYWSNYHAQLCPEWLKKYMNYGRSSLMRTDLPSVSLLQKSPSSLVSCHATGFYPDRALMLWRKDGEDLHEDVDQGEILPNHDGSFQMSVDLDLSSVKPEDWRRYDCVFQLSGVKEDIITKLDERAVKNNKPGVGGDGEFPSAAVIGAVVGLLLLAVCIAGFLIWRRHNEKQKGFKRASTSDTSSSSVGVPVPTDE